MKVLITNREGTIANWIWWDDEGKEYQEGRDVSVELAQAKRQHKSLERVLAEAQVATVDSPQPQVIPSMASAKLADDHTHEELVDPKPVIHDHEEYERIGHEHVGHIVYGDLTLITDRIDRVQLGEASARDSINRRIDQHESTHSYASIDHPHPVYEQRLGNLELLLDALAGQVQQLSQMLLTNSANAAAEAERLNSRINELEARVKFVETAFTAHRHEDRYAPQHHGHDEYASAAELEAHMAEVRLRANARIISSETVDGRRQMIIEEMR